MKRLYLLSTLCLISFFLLFCGCENKQSVNNIENNQNKVKDSKNDFIESMYGRWIYEEDSWWFMEIQKNIIMVAGESSGTIYKYIYEINEIDIEKRYIIINIKQEIDESDDSDEQPKNVDYYDKIIISQDKLTYIYKYNEENQSIISNWIKDDE